MVARFGWIWGQVPMAILDLSADVWRDALNMPLGQEPDILILEGTWWRETAVRTRCSHLTMVREMAFPDMFIGHFGAAKVAYCCAYGAARAVEPAHVFAQMGTPLIVQIGTCGALRLDLSAGAVMVPDKVAAKDGVAHLYSGSDVLTLDPAWSDRARRVLTDLNIPAVRGSHLTWPSLFAQSDAMCAAWTAQGFASVDMETSAVAAVAQHFGVAMIALLSVWDALPEGRTFLDPLAPAAATALARANDAVFTVALCLAEEVVSRRAA